MAFYLLVGYYTPAKTLHAMADPVLHCICWNQKKRASQRQQLSSINSVSEGMQCKPSRAERIPSISWVCSGEQQNQLMSEKRECAIQKAPIPNWVWTSGVGKLPHCKRSHWDTNLISKVTVYIVRDAHTHLESCTIIYIYIIYIYTHTHMSI